MGFFKEIKWCRVQSKCVFIFPLQFKNSYQVTFTSSVLFDDTSHIGAHNHQWCVDWWTWYTSTFNTWIFHEDSSMNLKRDCATISKEPDPLMSETEMRYSAYFIWQFTKGSNLFRNTQHSKRLSDPQPPSRSLIGGNFLQGQKATHGTPHAYWCTLHICLEMRIFKQQYKTYPWRMHNLWKKYCMKTSLLPCFLKYKTSTNNLLQSSKKSFPFFS